MAEPLPVVSDEVFARMVEARNKQRREEIARLRQEASAKQKAASALEKEEKKDGTSQDGGKVSQEAGQDPLKKATPRSRRWRRDNCKPYDASAKGPRRDRGGRRGRGGGSFSGATIQIGSGRPIVYVQK